MCIESMQTVLVDRGYVCAIINSLNLTLLLSITTTCQTLYSPQKLSLFNFSKSRSQISPKKVRSSRQSSPLRETGMDISPPVSCTSPSPPSFQLASICCFIYLSSFCPSISLCSLTAPLVSVVLIFLPFLHPSFPLQMRHSLHQLFSC